jgi:hypothetical protein
MPALSVDDVATVAAGERLDPDELARLRARAIAAKTETLGVGEGVDPEDLGASGWGVIFADDAPPAVREALRPLLTLRRSQASVRATTRYRELTGADGHHVGESAAQFLVRHGMAPGSLVDPDRMPYYLLLVGRPDRIPFAFQYQLDVSYSVGRLALDTPDEYARYAAAVVAADGAAARAGRRLTLFGPRNPDDQATALSVDHLIDPLATRLGAAGPAGWTVTAEAGAGHATKATLGQLLGGPASPDLLVTAGHGMVFPNGHPEQPLHQGALLCQDWPGRQAWSKAIPRDFYLAGDDLPDAHGPAGMIALLFACYGAGTPRLDDFLLAAGAPKAIAPAPFLAGLPHRMLSHPAGPALAVIGHVERAMSFSFVWPGIGEQLGVFEATLTALMKGRRVGAALEYFNGRYAALSTELDAARETIQYGGTVDPKELAGLWTARNDARNYVLLGDPAVRHPPAGVL